MAILGSDQFDVTTINGGTLEFHTPGGTAPAHDLTRPEVFLDHLEDVNEDGFVDLVSHYVTQDTGLQMTATEGCLSGATLGGMAIFGCDAVRIIEQ